uniref:phosphatidylinositol N-acetylglucosaminyltransferase n=1 Tax=Phallusia mammillata TaxID=59560 RepID=A0A6F9DPD8_9ASCI|nr:phosphatidylinositol N-acetylglucosaminyltransferase subunit A [Phallusia mammillata]
MTKTLNIAMVSDFFYPNVGGVENHIYQLAQCLLANGHKVIIITHSYENRIGLHFITGMLRVYYLPLLVFYNQCVLPTIIGTLPMIRTILLSEKIDIVHGHSSFSTLAHETMFHAKTLGIFTVFTDHSLFGFADASSILTNKILELSLADVNHAICVSHTSKENTVLRANLQPQNVFVIPNAIDPNEFSPVELSNGDGRLRIIVMSRLVYRKGMDLLAGIMPEICQHYSDVDFIIGGDGPKRLLLEETKEIYQLHDRIQFLGAVPHNRVSEILNQGDIFLNTSLTEAFCMSIVEAACCGLQVVSTSVGGIPEVLPTDLIHLADPSVHSLLTNLHKVIENIRKGNVTSKPEIHKKVSRLYTWPKVASRTEAVYHSVMKQRRPTLKGRIQKVLSCGPVIGKLFIIFIFLDHLVCRILDIIQPVKSKHSEDITTKVHCETHFAVKSGKR